LVVIGTRQGIEKVRCLLSSAPCEPVPLEGPGIHIIYLKHADAGEVAEKLNSFIENRGTEVDCAGTQNDPSR
jgi:hypothetical protein